MNLKLYIVRPREIRQNHAKLRETMQNYAKPRKTAQNNFWEHIETY